MSKSTGNDNASKLMMSSLNQLVAAHPSKFHHDIWFDHLLHPIKVLLPASEKHEPCSCGPALSSLQKVLGKPSVSNHEVFGCSLQHILSKHKSHTQHHNNMGGRCRPQKMLGKMTSQHSFHPIFWLKPWEGCHFNESSISRSHSTEPSKSAPPPS